jgi:hypothetical protein
LEPATAEDAELRYSLKHISLIDPGPYIALPYYWGDPGITNPINLGGHIVEITTNLDSALRAVRKMRAKEESRKDIKLWVDAICISQDDSQERSEQVRNMRQIYLKAREVIAWVGAWEAATTSFASRLGYPAFKKRIITVSKS